MCTTRVRLWLLVGLSLAIFLHRAYAITTPELVRANKHKIVMIVAFNSKGQAIGLGSGFYISADGEIATNYHIIEGADSVVVKEIGSPIVIPVRSLRYFDPQKDLAILKVDKKTDLVAFGNSDSIEVGMKVIAIGNPEGLEGSVSEGIISGVRSWEDFSLIQITAPISPGSSGGPLFDERGRVLGIVTAFLKEAQNLNFAIPINQLLRLPTEAKHDIPLFNVHYPSEQKEENNTPISRDRPNSTEEGKNIPLIQKGPVTLTWYKYDEGLAKAQKENKHIMVHFYTNWCGWCKRMDKNTFANEEVKKLLNDSYVPIKVNAESAEKVNVDGKEMTLKQVAGLYGVRAYPVTWFLKSNGERIAPRGGYADPQEFQYILKWVKDDLYDKASSKFISFDEFVKQQQEKENPEKK